MTAGLRLSDYADCLAALIEVLELAPAQVAGLSWGGTVVLELYRRRPEVVATLILVDTYAGWKGSLAEDELRMRVEAAVAQLAALDFESIAARGCAERSVCFVRPPTRACSR